MLIGLETAFSVKNLLMVVMGDPSAALILLAGVYYGAIFGGSRSSVLLNAPGVAGTVASAFDRYPMARHGKAEKALTIAAIASFVPVQLAHRCCDFCAGTVVRRAAVPFL